MAGVLRYKFKSERNYEQLLFDGMFISVGDLKRQIAEKRSMSESELAIHRSDSRELYGDDDTLLPRNTQVVITRVPLGPQTKKLIVERRAAKEAERAEQNLRLTSQPGTSGNDGLGGADASFLQPNAPVPGQDEAAALSSFVDASFTNWSSEVNAHGKGRFGARGKRFQSDVPPPNYVCHRCGVGGHWIYNCPTNSNPDYDIKKVKAPVGIPLEKLVSTGEGTILMPDGTIGDVMVDDRALAKDAPASFVKPAAPKIEIPEHMKCPICSNLINDAVLILCCQSSFCDKCIRSQLIETGVCAKCGKEEMLCDDLVPNPTLRQEIKKHVLDSLNPAASDLAIEKPKDGASAPQLTGGGTERGANGAPPFFGEAPPSAAAPQPPQQAPRPPAFEPQPSSNLPGPGSSAHAPEKKSRLKVNAFRIVSRGDVGQGCVKGKEVVELMRTMNKMLPNGPHPFFMEAFCRTKGAPLSRREFQYLQADFQPKSRSPPKRSNRSPPEKRRRR